MIADFGDVKREVQEHVLARVDHRNLNDVLENPTAENIARWIWETLEGKIPGLCEVRLYEIPDSCVTYRGPRGR
jgi:6-pyruvoyltetrahydropterin/6-carboxytetrahydropterin synthase